VGVTVNASRPFGDWVRGAAVLEGRREGFSAFDDRAGMEAGAPARRWGGVAGGEIDLRSQRLDLDVIPSARLEGLDDQVSGRNPAAAGVTPISLVLPVLRLGLVHPLGAEAAVKANIGRYGRAPSFVELYGNGSGHLIGNPTLDPERGTNADVGLWIDHRAEAVNVTDRSIAFGALVDDLIRWTNNPWGQSHAANLARARIYGLEEELRLAIGRRLALTVQGTWLFALDESDSLATRGHQIQGLPRYHGYARAEIRRVPLPGGLEAGAYVDGDLTAGDNFTGAGVGTFAAAALLGAGLSLSAPRARLRLTVSGANLTDVHPYQESNLPLTGRLVMVALAYAPIGSKDDVPEASLGSPMAW
jgi:outer membrane receptor protein involved in Fe transport